MDFLKNKKVIVFDTETTGLPARVPNSYFMSSNSYYPYNQNEKYNTSRLLSIAWYYNPEFTSTNIDTNDIKEFLRSPDIQITSIENSHIHGITYDDLLNKGIPFESIILEKGFGKAILECDYIVAHNILFDINILLNELNRLHLTKYIDKIKQMQREKRIICSAEIGKNICKIQFKNSIAKQNTTPASNPTQNKINSNIQPKYKVPKLSEFYFHFYNKEFENAHNASGDVKALLEIMMKM